MRRLLFATEKLDERSGSLFIFCQSLILVRIQVETLVLASYFREVYVSSLLRPRAHVLAKDDNNTAFILTSCHDASLLFYPSFPPALPCLALPCPPTFSLKWKKRDLDPQVPATITYFHAILCILNPYTYVHGQEIKTNITPVFHRDSSVCAC